ncbi:MAG: hypothetical protein V3U03_10775 [Myxococcota bacterium]
MGKIPLVLVIVAAVWVTLTVYREGSERAFGGAFAFIGGPQYGERAEPTRGQQLADGVGD